MKKVLIIDNYDSFTYNLVQLVGIMLEKLWKGEVLVYRNDEITLSEVDKINPTHLIISPGPCDPNSAGISVRLINYMAGKVPILGVCLGHQCIAQAFGGRIIRAKRLMHGKVSLIYHDGKGVFTQLPNPFQGMRYHSLAVDAESLPSEFEISARSEDGEIMGLRHKNLPIEGVQFHPESIGTSLATWMKLKKPPCEWDFLSPTIPEGAIILKNFLSF